MPLSDGAAPDLARLRTASWLRGDGIGAVMAAIAAGGYRVRAVGGVVRNTLLGEPVTDIDLATDAAPDVVMALAKAAGLGVAPTGLAHGTVTVIVAHEPFEVTSLRRDVETDGRRAVVAFTDDWAEDARRRDFTINALYADGDGALYDPLGGLEDLRARRVRFIGDAHDRIREDYLRILRFFRFHARYGEGAMDRDGLAACVRLRAGLFRLSAERVRTELLKLVLAPRAVAALQVMADCGLLGQILAGVGNPQRLARLIAIEEALAMAPDPIARLAALAVHSPADADRLASLLKLSNAEAARLKFLAANLAAPATALRPEMPARAQRAALYRLGAERYRGAVVIAWLMAYAAHDRADWAALYHLPVRWTPPRFPIDGRDVMAIAPGVKGPHIGAALAAVEAQWIAADFAPSREALLALLADQLGSAC